MKQLIVGVLLLVGTISSMASDFTITPAFQQNLSFYDAGNQTIFFDYQFKIHNNMRYPLYLNNKKLVYTSGDLKATFNPVGSTCSFFMEKLIKTTPVLPNKDCIIAYTYTLKKSVFLNGKVKSFISTLRVLDQLGLTVNYTATIKLKAFSRDTHKHVLLVGLDGTRGDAFKIAVKKISTDDKNYHFINEMIKGGKQDYLIYAGGNSDRPETKQTTMSGPGWATILTGVWADKHGINSNTDIEKNYHKDIPTVFNDIKDAIPKAYTVSLAERKDISTFANFKFNNHNDAACLVDDKDDVTTKAIEELKHNPTPTFMFLQYDAIDQEGQATGYDPEIKAYMDAIKTVLGNANRVLEEVQKLRDSGQQWLVIFVSNHGGERKGHFLRWRNWGRRQVFATYHDPEEKRYSGGGEINAFQGQTNITPTILDYFGIPIPKKLYGKPINAGELPVRWLWAKYDWLRADYRDEHLVDDYPQLARNVLPKLGDNIKKINKALMSEDSEISSRAYFFLNDGTYITYNVITQQIISGPEPIKSHWKCLTDPKIASAKIKGAVAFNDNNKNKEEYFFLFDNNYCTLCEPNPPHDTVKVNLSNPNSNYPKKLEKFSPGWAKLMNKYSANNSNLLIVRKGKRNSSKNIGSDTIYVLIDEVGKYVSIEPFNAHIPDSGVGSNDFTNHYWPGLSLFKTQTALSPSSNGDSKEDKLTGYDYAVFLKPMKYN